MNRAIASNINDLPTEIILQILALFSRHESTVCLRVSKAWYNLFIDQVWHKVHIWHPDVHRQSTNYHCFVNCYGEPKDSPTGDAITTSPTVTTVAASSHLGPHLHRIKVLSLEHASLFDIFYRAIRENDACMDRLGHDKALTDQEPSSEVTTATASVEASKTKTKLYFEDLGIDLDYKGGPARTPAQVTAFQDVLQRATGTLKKFTVKFNAEHWDPEDQAYLLAALPRNIEQLELRCFGFRNKSTRPKAVEMERLAILDRIAEIPVATEAFERLRSLTIAGLSVDMEVLMALLKRCPALEELEVIGISDNMSGKLAQVLSKGACCSYIYNSSSSNDPGFAKKGRGGGWKRLIFGPSFSNSYDELVVDAILDNRETLEYLQIVEVEFPESAIQRLEPWRVRS
ncbi:hypothetical protein EMPS_07328 [Entomortierella parvispora]|uniref:F-box domain-containing protein n=1 Tax=Entomortierella parvispora TaxID=205924 RepID=A0A9P3HDX9_9FUNG|nr:hypothetical protein EMPS_07328 [Entomortierella parvispora]